MSSILFTAECNVKDVTYKDGDSFYIPQNPIHYNDIGCKACSCDRGVTTCPNEAKCDVFSKVPCEKLIPAPQGKCCPTCGEFIWWERRGAMATWFSSKLESGSSCPDSISGQVLVLCSCSRNPLRTKRFSITERPPFHLKYKCISVERNSVKR